MREASLSGVEPLMQKIHGEIRRVDASILSAVRQQAMAPSISKSSSSSFSYSTLDDIDDKVEPQSIVVRLLRTWEARDFKRANVLLSVDCLLLDEKANAIQASIHPRCLYKFKNKLIEGQIFSVTGFEVKKHFNSYRLTDHDYKIWFNNNTSMEDVDGSQYKISHEYYRICPYKDIELMVDKGENLPDIVAQVSSIRTSEKVDETKSPPKSTFNLILTCIFESGVTANVSVWEKLALEVQDDLKHLKGVPIVVIVTGVNPKTVRGQLYLNATASTRVFFNKDNTITNDFRKSPYFEKSLVPTSVDGKRVPIPTDIQCIAQVLAYVNEQGGQEKMFWCKANVVDVLLGSGWFYISCTSCNKKMTTKEETLTCKVCGAAQAIGVLRYRIEVIVDDGSQTTTFVIFDQAAQSLFKITAPALAAENDVAKENCYGDKVPQVICDLVGREFLFHVKVSSYNYTAKHQSFSVSEIHIPPVLTKKRNQTCETSKSKPSTKFGNKSGVGGQELKKRRSTRKNKTQVVIEDSDNETLSNPHSDQELEADD